MTFRTAASLLLLLGHAAAAQGALSCERLLGQEQTAELPYLRTAPHGASRPTKHSLVVKWSKGVHDFVDKAPYWEQGEDGSRHLYCGFDAQLGMHLIYKIDETSGRGVLLDDVTGRVLPGGETVTFA